MVYLVTRNSELFDNEDYKIIGVEESLSLLSPLKIVGLDTETEGFSPFLKKLLLTQLGCYDFQVVVDNRTVPIELYRDFLQSDRLFLGWNLKFDLRFMYYHNIIPRNIYDGYLMEKAIWQGYPSGMHSLSLKAAGETYCGVELDKSVRGKIIWSKSLTPDIIKYAAEDVKYLEKIRKKQIDILVNRGQKRLIDLDIENKAVLPTAYFEFCGTKLDVDGWKLKMQKDKKRLIEAEDKLNKFVVDFYKSNKANLEQYSIVDWFDFSKGLPQYKWKPYKGDTSKLPPIPGSQDQAWNSDYHPIIKIFPFVKVDLQGNLFTGYDTEPKCIVNWNSARQVIPLLEYFGFNLMTIDKETGKPKKSVDATIIESQRNVHKIADVYLEYKAAQKVVSTYGQNVLDLINPATGRIHTNFNQIGTDTFRLSSGGGDDHEVIPGRKIPLVNLQNLPADTETRACFIAEKGNKWISLDYSSEESVILANISKDKNMIELFITGCKDLHSMTAKMIYKEELKDIPVEKVKKLRPDLRKKAKSPEFKLNT